MRFGQALLLLALALPAAPVAAQPAAAPRAEVPIREVVLSDGARRYTVPVRVGTADLEAGLDTGSTGLRILPGAVEAPRVGRADPYAFGSGVSLQGALARPQVTIGALSGPASVELVERIGCVPDKPRCPASRIPPSAYGIQGDGLANEGFRALIGTNMGHADAENPLEAIGARRWIVELPRPGEGAPGRLILNPTDAETEGFVYAPVLPAFRDLHGGLHDAVAGCLAKPDGGARACGALMLDSGAPGISLNNGGLGPTPWPEGTHALLMFVDGKSVVAGESFVVGLRAHASHLAFAEDRKLPGTVIYSGLSPYFAFSVLYDPEHQRIGFRPRAPAPGGPQGALAAAAPEVRK